MQITFKKDSEKFSFPLPIYETIKIGEAVSKDGEDFSVFVGLDKKIASQLKQLSLDKSDTDLQKNTSDKKRFGLGSYEDWYKKNRTPFALIHKDTNALAALVWFGPEPLDEKEGNWHTAAWRSYPSFRGKGLMKDFTKFAMDAYVKSVPNIKFWIKVKKDNTGSIGLAQALGFQKLQETSPGASLLMVKYL